MTENTDAKICFGKNKKIAVLSDLSGYGRCSLTVSLPIISALGIQACPLPTAILSNHTAFPGEYKYDFTDQMKPYMEAWEQLKLQFDGIIIGYMNYDAQVKAAELFIDKFKQPSTLVFSDPAMADNGKLYRGFDEDYIKIIKEKIIKKSNIIKPNLTEACLLTGYDYNKVVSYSSDKNIKKLKSELVNMTMKLHELGPKKVIITGVDRNNRILNLVSDEGKVKFMSSNKQGKNRPGTGDIFSSVCAASLVKGIDFYKSVEKAMDFVGRAIAISEEANIPVNQGVIFEQILSKLSATSDRYLKKY